MPYEGGDPISFCAPNVEVVNLGDEEDENEGINVGIEEQLNGDDLVGDEEQVNEVQNEVAEDNNVSFFIIIINLKW